MDAKTRRLENYDPDFQTTHNLLFLVSSSNPFLDMINRGDKRRYIMFRVGTCHGLFSVDSKNYYILAIANDQPHNGHLRDTMEWFEHSCVRDKRNLVMLEVLNPRFGAYLLRAGFESWTDGADKGMVKNHKKMGDMCAYCMQ